MKGDEKESERDVVQFWTCSLSKHSLLRFKTSWTWHQITEGIGFYQRHKSHTLKIKYTHT